MWERSARALMAGGVQRVCLVVPADDFEAMVDKVCQAGLDDCCTLVVGGQTRAASVARGVDAVFDWMEAEAQHASSGAQSITAGMSPQDVLVAVHDAARPFVSEADVRAVVAAAERDGAAILGRRCVDTMKRVAADRIIQTVERSGLWHAQTPQVFRIDWLRAGLADETAAASAGGLTDDAALLEASGRSVTMVESSDINIKVTTQDDLQFANWLAEQRWRTV